MIPKVVKKTERTIGGALFNTYFVFYFHLANMLYKLILLSFSEMTLPIKENVN